MKIEAVDPLNLATICVATVMKVIQPFLFKNNKKIYSTKIDLQPRYIQIFWLCFSETLVGFSYRIGVGVFTKRKFHLGFSQRLDFLKSICKAIEMATVKPAYLVH